MRLLLDTHALIWFLEDSPRLSPKAKSSIENLENEVFVHAVSWFEISIKAKIAKLLLPEPIESIVERATENGIGTIDIKSAQLAAYQRLPFFEEHRDPFDRMIIATAAQDDMVIISNDPKFPLYPSTKIIW